MGRVRFPSGEFYDVLEVVVDAPGELAIALSSEEFDVHLIVLNAADEVLLEVDDSPNVGTNAQETVAIRAAASTGSRSPRHSRRRPVVTPSSSPSTAPP